MKSLFTLVCCAFLIFPKVPAQSSLYVSRDIKKAYTNETRNYDGTPGKNYWQNSANYMINAQIFPQEKLLKGNELLTYFNNSRYIEILSFSTLSKYLSTWSAERIWHR